MNEREALRAQIHGADSHVDVLSALEGLDPALAGRRVAPAPHSIFQILEHMAYWQDISLARLRGREPERPRSAALGWATPPAPRDAAAWVAAVARFTAGLRDLESMLVDPRRELDAIIEPARRRSAREEFLMVELHNSYHLGQIVLLRTQLGSWPPPRGGDTW